MEIRPDVSMFSVLGEEPCSFFLPFQGARDTAGILEADDERRGSVEEFNLTFLCSNPRLTLPLSLIISSR